MTAVTNWQILPREEISLEHHTEEIGQRLLVFISTSFPLFSSNPLHRTDYCEVAERRQEQLCTSPFFCMHRKVSLIQLALLDKIYIEARFKDSS